MKVKLNSQFRERVFFKILSLKNLFVAIFILFFEIKRKIVKAKGQIIKSTATLARQ